VSDSRYPNDFTGQYIAGQWRPGSAGTVLQDRNPYDQSLLTEIANASRADLDAAYRSAAAVQRNWARALPRERAAVFLRAAEVIERRHAEIVDWLIAESGSTRLKAEMEWGARCAPTRWPPRPCPAAWPAASCRWTSPARRAACTAARSAWSA
jgi:aldehyde dehydrogenase (NAD+)